MSSVVSIEGLKINVMSLTKLFLDCKSFSVLFESRKSGNLESISNRKGLGLFSEK